MQLTFLCADFSMLGRFDPSMLTEQQMLELFFTPQDENEARADLRGDADDGCTWMGITCTYEYEETTKKSITGIDWCPWEVHLVGSIDFRRIPPHTEFISLNEQALSGTMDATGFPESLTQICLQKCAFSGTIDLGHLPEEMQVFEVYDNCFTAVQNVCDLPYTLESLVIEEPSIESKTIHVGELPANDLQPSFIGCGFIDFSCESDEDRNRIEI